MTIQLRDVPSGPPQRKLEITAKAVTLHRQMERMRRRCSCAPRDWDGAYWEHRPCEACEKWQDLHAELHNELQLEPWVWACWEHPSATSPYPKGSPADEDWSPNLEGQSLWQLLDEASKASRRNARRGEG